MRKPTWKITAVILIVVLLIVSLGITFQEYVQAGNGTFYNSNQTIGSGLSQRIALGDLDGDSDLDAFIVNSDTLNGWWRNANGIFSNSGQTPGSIVATYDVALADVNGDTYLDAFLANYGSNEVWLNNGSGVFSNSGQTFGSANSEGVALGDLDADGDMDAFVANLGANTVWLNGENGNPVGTFTDTLQTLGSANSRAVALGDIDGDLDLDAVVANGSASSEASKIWKNDGDGWFTIDAQNLSTDWNYAVSLGDLDNDDDLDIVFSAWTGTPGIWINQGKLQGGDEGDFQLVANLVTGTSLGLDIGDVDADNDLDIILGRYTPAGNEVWLNQGGLQNGIIGTFGDSGQALDNSATYAVALGKLDEDADLDLFFSNFGANQVWFNGTPGVPDPYFDVEARRNDSGDWVYPWAQSGEADVPVKLGSVPNAAINVIARIESQTSVITETLPFAVGQTTASLVVANPQTAMSETVQLSLDSVLAQLLSVEEVTDKLALTFIDAEVGDQSCVLCYADFLLKLMGIDTTFWQLHHLSFPGLEASLSWQYYHAVFENHEEELSTIVATNPGLLWQSFDVFEAWTPGLVAASNGDGNMSIVSDKMVDDAENLLLGIQAEASPALANRIESEMAFLDLDSFRNGTMDDALLQIENQVQYQLFLPIVTKN